MDVYLVGGAVRDELLGRPVTERDWVVVGATPEDLLGQGYRQVGRDFPVFLHPETAEEYALARTERKAGRGHTGFICHTGADVTLEADLLRRDLTVNAIARDASGAIIDPYGGRRDLERGILRHVSGAFIEDPLRVFRVARFAAQLAGFEVAPETRELMRRMAFEGALSELAPERVWQELGKALAGAAPERFFAELEAAEALSPWFSELAGIGVTVLHQPADPELRFAGLAWSLEPAAVTSLCERLRAPGRFQHPAEHVASCGRLLEGWRRADPLALLNALAAIGAFARQRDPEPVVRVVEACTGATLGGLRELIAELGAVSSEPFRREGLTGVALGDAIRDARLELIRGAQAPLSGAVR